MITIYKANASLLIGLFFSCVYSYGLSIGRIPVDELYERVTELRTETDALRLEVKDDTLYITNDGQEPIFFEGYYGGGNSDLDAETINAAEITTNKEEISLWQQWLRYELAQERLAKGEFLGFAGREELEKPNKPKPQKLPFHLMFYSVHKQVGDEWHMLQAYSTWCGTGLRTLALHPQQSIELVLDISSYKGNFKVLLLCSTSIGGTSLYAQVDFKNETGEQILSEIEIKERDNAIVKECIVDAQKIIKEALAEEDLSIRYASLVHLAKRIKELPVTHESELNEELAAINKTVLAESSFAENLLRNGVTTMPAK